MSIAPVTPELQQVVARLDTIIHELEGLRRQLTVSVTERQHRYTANLVDQTIWRGRDRVAH